MKKIKFLLCVVIALSVLILPFTAFGATTDYNNSIRWDDIAEDNSINLSGVYVIFRNNDGYYYIVVDNSYGTALQCNGSTIANTSGLIFQDNNWLWGWVGYKSSSAYNPYGSYNSVSIPNDESVNCSVVYANSKNILQRGNNSNVVFQQTPLAVQGGTQIPSGPTSSSIYNGVLIEVISILPILLPVLIVFLAIRKGLAFTLGTLRAS